jgi:hypothetical protein
MTNRPSRRPEAPFRQLRAALALGALATFGAAAPATARAQTSDTLDRSATSALERGREAPVATGVVDLPRLAGPVTLDGLADEPAWAAVEPLLLTMYEPEFRGRSDRTVAVQVAYDDEALYVAARFLHDDPAAIRAFSLTRDQWKGDDSFGVMLDTFNDNENAVRFVGLPLGTRMDMSISGDGRSEFGSGSGPSGLSWNTHWDLETRTTESGWFGEMRIPFSSLRFRTAPDGSVVMGMMAYAYEPGEETRWTYPAIPRSALYTQVSAWQDVRLRGIAAPNPVYVSPYVLSSRARRAVLAAEGAAFEQRSEQQWEVGGDLKINPTPNLTLDLTINTDFASVEADEQQVNLTRFSLFFDEKRPFFQERAGIFAFGTGTDRGTLFYSRRIGLSADGQPIPILGGTRLVGRIGSWDLGLIDMQTEEAGGVPSENFGVLRLRRTVVNDHSYVGGMATSRVASGGGHNVTWGLDGQLRVLGDEYLTFKWLQTVQGGTPALDATPGGLDAGRVVVDWTRRRFQGLSYQHVFVHSRPGYDPGVGFEERRDFTRAQSDWGYQWFPDLESPWRRIWLGLESNVWVRNTDDEVDTGQVRPFLSLETNDGLSVRVHSDTRYEDVPQAFPLSDDVEIPSGSYWATEGVVRFGAPRGWAFRPDVTVTAGQFFDGRRFAVGPSFDWPANRYLQLQGSWEWNRIRFEERDQAFDSNLLRLTARAALDVRLSFDVFAQYNSLVDQVATNARLRYNVREGRDLWLVWNEGLNLERDLPDQPRLPTSGARTLAMKYTHTLIF